MIKPTNGRVVLFTPAEGAKLTQHDPAQALAATIVHVYGDELVNLVVFNSLGVPRQFTSVVLLQDNATPPASGCYAEWMPFQKGQAAKTEALEAKAAGAAQA